MRQLTEQEKEATRAAWRKYNKDETMSPLQLDAWHNGFIAALDHSADKIAALEAENARFREALKPFAEYAITLTNWDSDPVVVAKWGGIRVTAGDFRKAAAALDNT